MKLGDDNGQALVITTLFITVLLGALALALDVGSWFRESRQAQATADAAALSSAQALPAPATDGAYTLATQYASENGGGVDAGGIRFKTEWLTNDTVEVRVTRKAAGFFSVLFGIDSATVHARASARAGVPAEVRYVAPIVVNQQHPQLSGPGCPCFNTETTLPLGKDGAPGAFGLMNLDPNATKGAIGTPTLADWLQNGYSDYLPLGTYYSDPGAKFNSSQITDALELRIGTEMLFPVFDSLTSGGANAKYNIIGWAGFHLDGFDDHGLSGSCPPGTPSGGGTAATLCGHFTRVIWDGLQSADNSHVPNFGVYSVSLVN